MDKRERVMKGLECCTHGVNKCAICPYDPRYNKTDEMNARSCMTQLAMDALELLKAQEPRVMTIEEVKALEEGTIVCVEENYGGQRYLSPMVCHGDGLFGNFYFGIDIKIWLYDGKKRFWTSKPTKEQSEAIPWEPPKEEPC